MSTARAKKTDIVRKRTGCQRCRSKRRKCDENRPECIACVQRGLSCPGYQRQLTFKDVSARTAELSKRIEETKWTELRRNDARRSERGHPNPRDQPRQRDAVVETPGHDVIECISPERQHEESPNSADGESSDHGDIEPLLPRPTFEPSLDFLMDQVANPLLLARRGSCDIPDPTAIIDSNVTTTLDRVPPPVSMGSNSCIGDQLASYNDDEIQVQLWDHFINFPEASRPQTPSNLLLQPGGPHSQDLDLDDDLPTEEDLLRNFEEHISHMIPLTLPFEELFRGSSGLRAAALALSASHLRWSTQTQPSTQSSAKPRLKCQSDCHYYDFAVRDLTRQLKQMHKRSGEQLFGATMLLIYRDWFVGAATDVLGHLQKLETISTQLDISSLCTSTLLRAWRMLLYDMRTRMMPTRKSAISISVPQQYLPWDAQLAIREIYSSIWTFHVRFIIEASFSDSHNPSNVSPSQKAVQWLYSVLGRQCDLHQLQQGDYHEQDLSFDVVADRCMKFETCLDNWHESLQPHDLPTLKLGKAEDIITGPSFGAIVPYQFTDDRKALDYMSYLVSRTMCSYLRSKVLESSSAAASQAYAWTILGIAATIGLRKHQFFGPGIFTLLLMAAMISEGTVIATAILDGLLPRARAQAPSLLEAAEMRNLQKTLELIVRERNCGKAIRVVVSAFDENETLDKLYELQTVVAFGDYSGRESFRDVFQFSKT